VKKVVKEYHPLENRYYRELSLKDEEALIAILKNN